MRSFSYQTCEVLPEDLYTELNKMGGNGWEFKQLVVMNRSKPVPRINAGMQVSEIEIKFLLIFIKEDQP
jgi:hypothetical protein